MRILQAHCRYRSGLGGEDSVVAEEKALLESHGHTVAQFTAANADFESVSGWRAAPVALSALWNRRARRELERRLRADRPDVLHVHNTFAALSPSVFWAARAASVPVVYTLHNYRLTCATGMLLRAGAPCERCVRKMPWPAFLRRCPYNHSRAAGAVIAAAQSLHHAIGTWTRAVDVFVALTDFQKQLMLRAGLPAERVEVKPNFVQPAAAPAAPARRAILFAGLVSRSKGVDLLLAAWERIPHDGVELAIVGHGAEAEDLRARFAAVPDVRWLGRLDRARALDAISAASWLAAPSRWYEGMPMVVLEALARGVPVIAPDHGAFRSILEAGRTGLLFRANDEAALAGTLSRAVATPAAGRAVLSAACRESYAARYTPETNYRRLLEIYELAVTRREGRG